MLLSDVVKIEINSKNLKYYQRSDKDLNIGSIIFIPFTKLSKNSGLKVDVKCDYCGDEFKMEYRKYLRSVGVINKNSCKKGDCSSLKVKESNRRKYGVENVMQLPENVDKVKKTNIERWGVDHPMQLSEIKDKVKKTNIERWGVDHPMHLSEIKDKIKKTNLIKYGTENPMQSECVKSRVRKTNLEKYGVENYTQTDEYKDKSKKTNIEKWGVDNYTKTEEYKSSVKKTNLDKYGVEYLFQSKEFRDSIIKSNLDKYGVEYYTQTNEFLEKIKETCLQRFGVDNPMKSDNIKEKLRKSFIKKYGVDNPNKLSFIREKIIKTNLDKYGFEYPSQSPIIKEKVRLKNIINHGVTNIMYSEEFRKQNFIISKHPNYIRFIVDIKSNEFKCDCNEPHNFRIPSDNFYKRLESNNPLCTVCYPIGDSKSIKEVELYKFINNLYKGEIIQSYRDGLEIDIYLPDLKIGFEFNGLYWHSDLYRNKLYHLEKLKYFSERGIRIINIWEDDWTFKNEIIKSQIKNIIDLTNNKVYARKCQVKEVKEVKLVRNFLDNNHIQGFVNSKIKLGLYYDGDLVSLMTFDQFEGRKKMGVDEWNLSRFCNKLDTSVIGGASKLIKYFIDFYKPKRIISYADKDWSVGKLYDNLGFKLVGNSKPDYKYIVDGKRIHKSRFRKSFTGISESKINIPKIWDCGKIKYEVIL
jgi:hypothetical protein